MQLQQLVYFLAVARTRHFTRAAEQVHVAQPSLSKQIQNLEAELGTELFQRARGNVGLTPAGEVLLPLAKRILADVETARLQVHELAELRSGRLRLGATPSLCTGLLADALVRFRSTYPGIELIVDESGSRDLVRQIAEGALDLAVITSPLQRGDPVLDAVAILREELTVAVPCDAEPGLVSIRVADLEHRALVMFRDGYDLRAMTLAECQRAGFTPRFAIEGGEMDAVLSFVEAGLGVAVVPSMVLPSRPKLRGVSFVAPRPIRTIALAHRSDVRPPRAAEAFRATLLGLIDDAHARGTLPAGVEIVERAGTSAHQPGSGSGGSMPVTARTSSRTTRNANPSG